MICKLYNQISFYIILELPIFYTCLPYLLSFSVSIHPSLDMKYLNKKANYQKTETVSSLEKMKTLKPSLHSVYTILYLTGGQRDSKELQKADKQPQTYCNLEHKISRSCDSCSGWANQVKFLKCRYLSLWNLLLMSEKIGIVNEAVQRGDPNG